MDPIWLDLKDKRILSALNQDVRASYTELAKKASVSKEVANYRVSRLIQEKVISEFVTIIGLGYRSYKVLIEFSKAKDEKAILDYLESHPNVTWLTSCSGGYDLVFSVMAKDPIHFEKIIREIMARIGGHIGDYKLGISAGSTTFGHRYILGGGAEVRVGKSGSISTSAIDKKDKAILSVLQKDARASLTSISSKTRIPIDTVKYHLKRMEESGVIKRYRMILDSSKLGYNRYEVFIRCIVATDPLIEKFKEYARNELHIEYFSRCVGAWDIEMTAHFKTPERFREFLLGLKSEFGEHIQKIETITLFETRKHTYQPEEMK